MLYVVDNEQNLVDLFHGPKLAASKTFTVNNGSKSMQLSFIYYYISYIHEINGMIVKPIFKQKINCLLTGDVINLIALN